MEEDTTKKTTAKTANEEEELDPAFYADPSPAELVKSEATKKHGGIPGWVIALIIIFVVLPVLSSLIWTIFQFFISTSINYF